MSDGGLDPRVALFDALPESGRPAEPTLVQLIALCDQPLIMEADRRLIGPYRMDCYVNDHQVSR